MTDLLIDALAVFRLTRLVTTDTILDRPREAVRKERPGLFLFLTCPWCVGMWLAAGVVLVAPHVRLWRPLRQVLALSAIAGLLAERS